MEKELNEMWWWWCSWWKGNVNVHTKLLYIASQESGKMWIKCEVENIVQRKKYNKERDLWLTPVHYKKSTHNDNFK